MKAKAKSVVLTVEKTPVVKMFSRYFQEVWSRDAEGLKLRVFDDVYVAGLQRQVPAYEGCPHHWQRWPDGKEAKARIIRREKIDPNRPQPA